MESLENKVKLRDVNYLYLIIMVLFVLCGVVLQVLNPPSLSYGKKMSLTFLAQVLFVCAPACIFVLINKVSLKELRFNKVSFANLCLSAGIIVFSAPIVLFINLFWMMFLQYIGKIHAPADFTAQNIYQLIINLLIVAVTPAIFEELLFRGIILKGYERFGRVGAIIFPSILFGLLHRDIQSLVGTILLGVIISFVVYKTNSIYPGMLAHFINNGFVVVYSYMVLKFMPQAFEQVKNTSGTNLFPQTEQLIVAIIFLGIIAAVFLAVLIGLLIIFNHTTKGIYEKKISINDNISVGETIPLVASAVLILFVYIRQLM